MVWNGLAGTSECLVALVALNIDSSVVAYTGDGAPAGVYLGIVVTTQSRKSSSARLMLFSEFLAKNSTGSIGCCQQRQLYWVRSLALGCSLGRVAGVRRG